MTYTLMVSGYRKFNDYDLFSASLDKVIEEHGKPSLIIHGDCEGADKLATRWCKEHSTTLRVYPADWSKGPSAGPIRNSEMLKSANVVCAFLHKDSKGTKDVINKAKKLNVILYLYKIE